MAEMDLNDLRLEPIEDALLPPRRSSDPGVTRDQTQLPVQRRQSAPDAMRHKYYELGNHDIGPFLNKMQGALSETNSMKNQCIEAARVSPARNQQERNNIELFRRSIDDAHGASKVARGVETVGRQQLGKTPRELGHLTLPSRHCSESSEFVLPGAVEAFRDPSKRVEDDRRQWETGIRRTRGGIDAYAGPNARIGSKATDDADSQVLLVGNQAASAMETDLGPQVKEVGEEDHMPCVETDLAVQDEDGEVSTAPISGATSPLLKESLRTCSPGTRKSTLTSVGKPGSPTANVRKPSLRFKILAQFNERFNPSDPKGVAKAASQERRECEMADIQAPDEDVHDQILGWVRHDFRIDIKTKNELEAGFPLIILTALDAVYGNRVKWTEVDWDLKYARATWKNIVIMQKLWEEVGMDSSREFRSEATDLRLEAMFKGSVRDRLNFLKLLHRWLKVRVPDSEPYNAMARRRQYVEQCRIFGKEVTFPSWILYEEEQPSPMPLPTNSPRRRSLSERPNSSYLKMPEFRRLSWFLGSQEQPTM